MSNLVDLQTAQEAKWLNSERRLAFHPPVMINPWVYQAATGEDRFPRAADVTAGRAYTLSNGLSYFNPTLDVIIKWPTTPLSLTRTAWILGGRHVRSIGGELIHSSGSHLALLTVELASGSVFIEGMLIDSSGEEKDAIAIRWDQDNADEANIARTTHPDVTIQHCRAIGIDGSFAGEHGDAVQNQTEGIDFLRIEKMTLESAYQGIFPMGSAGGPVRGVWLRRVNTKHYSAGARYLLSYWFHNSSGGSRTSGLYDIHLDQTWATENPSDDWEITASTPNDADTWGPTLDSDAAGEFLDFSDLGLQMTGRIRKGQPPTGDFASAASVGVNYRSPWPIQAA